MPLPAPVLFTKVNGGLPRLDDVEGGGNKEEGEESKLDRRSVGPPASSDWAIVPLGKRQVLISGGQ
jgi:hypothetical protein